jgi:ATP-dependent DNA ligase
MTPQQLCQLVGNWDGRTVPIGAVIETKHDGFRALYIRDWEGRPGLWTRNGHPIEGVGHILHQCAALERIAGEPLMLDGEFCVGDGPDTLAATKAWCERDWKTGGEAGTYHAFDAMPFADWQCGGTDTPWIERKERLIDIALAAQSDAAEQWTWRAGSRGRDDGAEPVRVVPHRDVWHPDDVLEAAGEIWAADLEGVIIKSMWGGYQRRRSPEWQKVGRPWRDKIGWKRAA